MGYLLEYDETNPISIETYGKRLIGKTFQDICDEDDMRKAAVVRETENYEVKHENKKRKGGLGELVEERYFHYQSNNDARPDFDKAGVELKVTPYKINKNGSISAKERLILTMIDYCSVVNESFEESHMWAKARLILLVYYLYRQEIKNRLDYKIDYVQLFSPPEEDMKIIEHGVVGVNAARERFQENIDNHNINKPVMIVPLDIDFDLDTYDFSEAEKGYDEISREIQELEQKISWNKKKITVLNDKKKNADSEKAKIIKEEIKDLRNEKKHNQQELDELKNLYKISDEIEEI